MVDVTIASRRFVSALSCELDANAICGNKIKEEKNNTASMATAWTIPRRDVGVNRSLEKAMILVCNRQPK